MAGQGTGADIWSSRGTRWTDGPFPKAKIFSAILITFSSVPGLFISSIIMSVPPSFSNIGQYLVPTSTTQAPTLTSLLPVSLHKGTYLLFHMYCSIPIQSVFQYAYYFWCRHVELPKQPTAAQLDSRNISTTGKRG